MRAKKTLVEITWRDPLHDWPWFYLLAEHEGWLFLQGADFPDGSGKHEGDCFCVRRNEIRTIRHAR